MTYREILDLGAAAPRRSGRRAAVYPLVGRLVELRVLWPRGGPRKGAAAPVLIRGEAGVGKTRLAEELVDGCRRRLTPGDQTRCYAGEGRLGMRPSPRG